MRCLQVTRTGPAANLEMVERPLPHPAPAEVLLRITHVGVNFVDVQHRRGEPYPVRSPFVPGIEAVGVAEAIGNGVSGVKAGDRLAVAGHMPGLYAEYAAVPARVLVPVPDAVSSEQAAAVLLQGMTAHMLTETITRPGRADVVLIHAVTGGVGSLLAQRCKFLGATVIGTVSRPDKAQWAREVGCDHVLVAGEQDAPRAVRDLTGSAGATIVFDSVGADAFQQGLLALRPRGHMVCFGQSGGPVPPIDPAQLSGIIGTGNRGSLTLTWPTLNDHNAHRQDLLARAAAVFGWVERGEIDVRISARFALEQAAQAHLRLEERRNVGKILLVNDAG